MLASELSRSKDFRDGLNSEVPPFGQPAFAPAGFADEAPDPLTPYGKRETDEALDWLQADIDAAPDEPEPLDLFIGGAEMEGLKSKLEEFVRRRLATMPAGWAVEPAAALTLRDGKLVESFSCFVVPNGTGMGLGAGETLEAATNLAEANMPLHRRIELEEFRLRQRFAGEEQERMAETDCTA